MYETTLVTLVQDFGWDATYAGNKILIQWKNSAQNFAWFDWYANPILPPIGSVITVSYSGSGSSLDLHKLINTGNGKEARILRFAKAY
ncbi:hypothetical protein [Calothrix sp. UHCC 0171]|uniref:hypothetical protein n=1 Tax=Calothrix sp. UHCC 0171 TaxID=3110245 RepID=UPI002B21D262|nr:hypothetical protein [Calothrix sp. UHCC 0171]MEA5573484.1 hypothetical protein [Calothrix sp. UHCC 0171]